MLAQLYALPPLIPRISLMQNSASQNQLAMEAPSITPLLPLGPMATTTKTIRLTEQLLTFSKDAMSKYATLILGSIVFLMAILYVVFRPTDVVRPSLITVEVQSGILAFKEYVSNKLGF